MTKRQRFDLFITEHLDSAYRFAYAYTGNVYDAEDVVQESVAKALSKLYTLRNPEVIKPWFYRILSNTALTLLRRKKRMVPIEDEAISDMMGGRPDNDSLAFEAMMSQLSPAYRSVVALRFLEEMTLEEIALALALNVNTVKSRLYRALEQLRIEMEEPS